MAQTYREITGGAGSLGSTTPCPGCGPGSNYLATNCTTGTTYSVSPSQACESGSLVALSYTIQTNDVVLLRPSCGAQALCAEITGSTNTPVTHYIDQTPVAPWTQCSSCQVP